MKTSFALAAVLFVTACGSQETTAPLAPAAEPAPLPAPAADPHAEHAAHGATPGSNDAPMPAMPTLAPEAKVFFTLPAEGANVIGPLENGSVMVKVQMGASGVAIKPAGAIENGSGHHHVLVDTAAMPAGTVVPKDAMHLHFGTGQTEATIPLAIGPHTLTLQLADGIHRSYGEALSSTIKITVSAAGSVAATAP